MQYKQNMCDIFVMCDKIFICDMWHVMRTGRSSRRLGGAKDHDTKKNIEHMNEVKKFM